MTTDPRLLVRLRSVRLSDVEDHLRWWQDPEFCRHLNTPDRPYTRRDILHWLDRCRRGEPDRVTRAIETPDGLHVGWCDLKTWDRRNRHAEFGIAIGERSQWGKGYGLGATLALLEHGFRELALNKIWLRVDCDHPRAIKCYLAAGFVTEGVMRQDRRRTEGYVDRLRFSLLRDEFVTRWGFR